MVLLLEDGEHRLLQPETGPEIGLCAFHRLASLSGELGGGKARRPGYGSTIRTRTEGCLRFAGGESRGYF